MTAQLQAGTFLEYVLLTVPNFSSVHFCSVLVHFTVFFDGFYDTDSASYFTSTIVVVVVVVIAAVVATVVAAIVVVTVEFSWWLQTCFTD